MKTHNAVFIVLAIVLVTSLLCVWFVPSIQDFMASNTMWNGIRNFLKEFDASTIDSLDGLPESPEGSALIIIPYLEYSDEELLKLKGFVEQGGTLVLLDDYGFGNEILEYFGLKIRFADKPLLDPLFCYRNQWLPKITDFAPAISQKNITVVVLNHATILQDVPPIDVVAWSSPSSFLDININERQEPSERTGPFIIAAKSQLGKGTLVLASDPSIMINSMVNRDDNFAFMRELISLGRKHSEILLDTSHLTQTPLDISKSKVTKAREVLSTPYSLLAIMAVIFIIVSRFILRAGGTVERKPQNL
jgi:hypothetical protein